MSSSHTWMAILSVNSLLKFLEFFFAHLRALTFEAPLKSLCMASSISFSVTDIL